MAQVRIRPKGQVTIPASILESAQLKVDSTLEVALIHGVITLTPKPDKAQRPGIMAFAGIFKDTWGKTPVEIDKTLNDLRDEWER